MLCTDASPVHPVLKNLLLGADVITPMVCTDASPVQPLAAVRVELWASFVCLLVAFYLTPLAADPGEGGAGVDGDEVEDGRCAQIDGHEVFALVDLVVPNDGACV